MEPNTTPDAAATPGGANKGLRGGKRLLLLVLLLALLGGTSFVWIYYLNTRQPITNLLPPARAVAKGLKPRYLFSIYGVTEPVGVAVSRDGNNIYVAETGGERMIRVFDRDGKPLSAFAPPGSVPMGRAPVYLAVDAAGQVYVSDRMRRSVDIYDAGGNFKSSLKPLTSDGWLPLGVRFSGDSLLLTEVTNGKHRVMEMNRDGGLTMIFGREGRGQGDDELWFPNSVVVDGNDRVYVSDSNNARVRVFDRSGSLIYTIPGLSLPRGLAIDDEQRLYVVDAVGHTVNVFDASKDKDKGKSLFSFGNFGAGDGEFNYPNDIALDHGDRLYIADRASNRVQVWVY